MSIVTRLRIPLLSCVFAAVLAVLLPGAGAQAAAWSVVPSPDPAGGGELNGVASISANDVWAVGGSSSGTLTMHWNGQAWKAVNSPNAAGNTLTAASALSSTDVWAVGSSGAQTLTEHWNGHQWKVVPSPGPGTLAGVAAVSATDVWAVGSVAAPGSGPRQTLIEHWNGTSWSVVPSPDASTGTYDNQLKAVTAVSATDAWAVGKSADTGSSTPKTLIEHWNGTNWSVVPSPDASTGFNVLTATAAVSASDEWAVGEFASGTTRQALIEHWDGTSWSVVPSANPSPGDDGLNGVAAVSATDIWAVGSALIEHWDGTSWAVVPSPSPIGNTLNAAAADPGTGQAWAVGSTLVTGTGGASTLGHQTLTEVYR
jgi:uncharacterized membrane protein